MPALPFALPPGGFPPVVHTVFEVGAVAAGARLYAVRRDRSGDVIPDARRVSVLIGAAVGALVGSRALAVLEHPGMFDGATALQTVALLLGVKTIVGGLLGALIGVEATKAFLGETTRTGDLYVFPLLLAIAVGRVGCLLAGVKDATAGLPTALPWGMDQGDGVLRHPTAFYEILFLGALALALRAVSRRVRLAPGALFALFLASYLAWRLGVEFLKPVEALHVSGVSLGVSAIQAACILGLLHYARLAAGGHLRPRPAEALPA